MFPRRAVEDRAPRPEPYGSRVRGNGSPSSSLDRGVIMVARWAPRKTAAWATVAGEGIDETDGAPFGADTPLAPRTVRRDALSFSYSRIDGERCLPAVVSEQAMAAAPSTARLVAGRGTVRVAAPYPGPTRGGLDQATRRGRGGRTSLASSTSAAPKATIQTGLPRVVTTRSTDVLASAAAGATSCSRSSSDAPASVSRSSA